MMTELTAWLAEKAESLHGAAPLKVQRSRGDTKGRDFFSTWAFSEASLKNISPQKLAENFCIIKEEFTVTAENGYINIALSDAALENTILQAARRWQDVAGKDVPHVSGFCTEDDFIIWHGYRRIYDILSASEEQVEVRNDSFYSEPLFSSYRAASLLIYEGVSTPQAVRELARLFYILDRPVSGIPAFLSFYRACGYFFGLFCMTR